MNNITRIKMPSQELEIHYNVREEEGSLAITINYYHPTLETTRWVLRRPNKLSFSQKHFEKELDAYIVQEAMGDLMDNRHTYDWVE